MTEDVQQDALTSLQNDRTDVSKAAIFQRSFFREAWTHPLVFRVQALLPFDSFVVVTVLDFRDAQTPAESAEKVPPATQNEVRRLEASGCEPPGVDTEGRGLLGEDFDGGDVAFHVEHFGAVVTAEEVAPVDADCAPVFVGVVLSAPMVPLRCSAPAGLRLLACVPVGEQKLGLAVAALRGGRRGCGGGGADAVQLRTRCLRLWLGFDPLPESPGTVRARGCGPPRAALWTAHLQGQSDTPALRLKLTWKASYVMSFSDTTVPCRHSCQSLCPAPSSETTPCSWNCPLNPAPSSL